jgi:hypothetical protein
VRVRDKKGTQQLVRGPITGERDRPLILEGGLQLAPVPLSPNAVDQTGRIVATVMAPDSYFWPAGVIDPNTGHVQIVRTGTAVDNQAHGWAPDGKLILSAVTYRSSLWRFRPEPSANQK